MSTEPSIFSFHGGLWHSLHFPKATFEAGTFRLCFKKSLSLVGEHVTERDAYQDVSNTLPCSGNDSSEIACNKSRDDNSTTASSVSTPRFHSSTNLATETGTAETGEKVASQKPIRRVCSHVPGQEAGLLSAEVDEFVCIWPQSKTELGWIYAEDPLDATRAGWMPCAAIEKLEEPGHAWLLVQKSMPAVHSNQLDVEVGEILKVNLPSRTPEGWAYAEKLTQSSKTAAAGWVPVVSLCWVDDSE